MRNPGYNVDIFSQQFLATLLHLKENGCKLFVKLYKLQYKLLE